MQTNSSALGTAIFSGPGGCVSRLSLTPSGGGSKAFYTHFCEVSYDYVGGGFRPSLNASGDITFHDTSSIGLPLDWGLRGMVASWGSGRLGVTGSALYRLRGNYQVQLTYSSVPEPASLAALGFGAIALVRRRRRARTSPRSV